MSDVLVSPLDAPPQPPRTQAAPERGAGGPGGPHRPETTPRGSEPWMVLLVFLSLTALVAAMVFMALDDGDGSAAPAASGPAQTIEVTLGDLFIEPAMIEVEAGRPLVFEVRNEGAMPHDFMLADGTGTEMIDAGGSATLEVDALSADTLAWCTVPGHRAAGMEMMIHVEGGAAAPAGGAAVGEEASTAAEIDFSATPAADFVPFDPTLAPAPGATEHHVTLHATETVIEVAPGVTQELWTFGDQVPGPILRGKVGDLFTVTLVNDGAMGHSIDFHASKVAWNDEMRTIGPGESLVYQFKAEHAGMFMYHCGTAPALHHIGNGMFGGIIIDPPELAPVDHEVVFVQSELYLGEQGGPGDLAKMQDDAWDAVVFNGYVNQYLHHPIRVEPGERVRAWVLDAGPSENSSFHIVGTVFDTVYKEGDYTLRPGPAQGGAQVLDLQPASGGFVEFSFAEAGYYPIVTHKFSNAGKGAMGLFQAGEVEGAPGSH